MIITNHLDASQSAQIADLEALCKKYDSLQGSIFLSNELNFDPELPCFYLLYNPENTDELIAFLSIFAPQSDEAEIYAYTAPVWRRQGCFNVLLEAALNNLWEYGIDNVLFVHEPASSDASAVLRTLGTAYQYSEYLLTLQEASVFADAALPNKLVLLPASEEDLDPLTEIHALAFKEEKTEARQFLANVFDSCTSHAKKLICTDTGELVGFCCFTIGRNDISIFSVAIHPAHRRKGCAAGMLKCLIGSFCKAYPHHAVTLEVNSQNTAAFSLYRKLGFAITTQFDYSLADCGKLLSLF